MKSPKKNRASLVELEAHFQRAIELPKPLREAYLKHACLGKPELEAEDFEEGSHLARTGH